MKAIFALALPALACADILAPGGYPTRHPVDPLPPTGPCALRSMTTRPMMGAYVPQCDSAGNFAAVQCHGSTGQCWCADTQTGVELTGTRQRPGSASAVTETSCAAAEQASKAGGYVDEMPGGASCGGFDENTGTMGAACAAGLTCITDPNMVCMGSCSGVCTRPTPTGLVDPGFSRPIRGITQAAAGARCAAGFCEDQNDCPQCAAGLTCATNPAMMCAGTCYGTCTAPAAAVPAGNPACWGGAYTSSRCCANGGDSTCWSGQFSYAYCCAAGGH